MVFPVFLPGRTADRNCKWPPIDDFSSSMMPAELTVTCPLSRTGGLLIVFKGGVQGLPA